MPLNVSYLVHDLNDDAVARRVVGLAAGGARVRVAGFYRREPVAQVAGAEATPLGHTADARLAERAGAVLRNLIGSAALSRSLAGADVVIARNLEMLVLAMRVRRPGQRVVYECLDIHRLMLGRGPVSAALRALEKALMRRCDLVMTSSPAFERRWFGDRQHRRDRIALVENRVLAANDVADSFADAAANPGPRPGPPWRIGWFGNLRCRQSLALLDRLTRAVPGRVEVVLAGRPARTELPDLEAVIAANPDLRFEGAYASRDLPRLYGSVHFAWAIDWFEAGLNSDWLLPNRLYESLAFGCVPIALAGVETGRWLAARNIGVRLNDPERNLATLFEALDPDAYARLRGSVLALPRSATVAGAEECRALVRTVAGAA